MFPANRQAIHRPRKPRPVYTAELNKFIFSELGPHLGPEAFPTLAEFYAREQWKLKSIIKWLANYACQVSPGYIVNIWAGEDPQVIYDIAYPKAEENEIYSHISYEGSTSKLKLPDEFNCDHHARVICQWAYPAAPYVQQYDRTTRSMVTERFRVNHLDQDIPAIIHLRTPDRRLRYFPLVPNVEDNVFRQTRLLCELHEVQRARADQLRLRRKFHVYHYQHIVPCFSSMRKPDRRLRNLPLLPPSRRILYDISRLLSELKRILPLRTKQIFRRQSRRRHQVQERMRHRPTGRTPYRVNQPHKMRQLSVAHLRHPRRFTAQHARARYTRRVILSSSSWSTRQPRATRVRHLRRAPPLRTTFCGQLYVIIASSCDHTRVTNIVAHRKAVPSD
jgi:hypothetical protein